MYSHSILKVSVAATMGSHPRLSISIQKPACIMDVTKVNVLILNVDFFCRTVMLRRKQTVMRGVDKTRLRKFGDRPREVYLYKDAGHQTKPRKYSAV